MEGDPEKCFITDLEADYKGVTQKPLSIEYYVVFEGEDNQFLFSRVETDWKDVLNTDKHILKGLFLNKKWRPEQGQILTSKTLKRILDDSYFPKTYIEKFNNLLLTSVKQTKYDGKRITYQQPVELYYLENIKEFEFYFNALKEAGYIDGPKDGFIVTYSGLNYAATILEDGVNSMRCFVAMSFSPDYQDIRKSIKNACKETGFHAILIDEIHPEAEQTINDLIISEIKRSKFLIADFTGHSDGVYFEAGYALGRGLKVIYSCHKEHWDSTHFDTDHFPHIRYDTFEELEYKLINKINAWIS